METNKTNGNELDNFIGMCLMSVTYTHSLHLASKSYSEHMALGSFYENIQELVDGLAESYIGYSGRYVPVLKVETNVEPIQYIKSIADEAARVYPNVETSWLKNQLDEISKLCYSTIYKLQNLR